MIKHRKIGILMKWMSLGGIEVSLMRLISAMRATGRYSFKLVVIKPIENARCLKFIEEEHIEVVQIDLVERERPKGFLKKLAWRYERAKGLRIFRKALGAALSDCDLAFDYSGDEFRKVIGVFKGPKYFWWHFSYARFAAHVRKTMQANAKIYSGFVMLSDSFAQKFAEDYPKLRIKTSQIYNVFDPEEVRALALVGPKHETSRPYFVSPSRLWWDKDNETILRAFRLFNERHPNAAELVFVGTGSEEEKLRKLAKDFGLTDLVFFKGGMDNPYAVVKGAIASILSSPQEGVPLVPLEAMALGVLPIASDVPDSIREELLDGEAGLLFPFKDAVALEKAMEMTFAGGDAVSRLKTHGAEMLNRFSAEVIIPQVEEMIA